MKTNHPKTFFSNLLTGFIIIIMLIIVILVYSGISSNESNYKYNSVIKNFDILNDFFILNESMNYSLHRYYLFNSTEDFERFNNNLKKSFQFLNELQNNLINPYAVGKVIDLKRMVESYSETCQYAISAMSDSGTYTDAYKYIDKADYQNQLINNRFKLYYQLVYDNANEITKEIKARQERYMVFEILIIVLSLSICIIVFILFYISMLKPINYLVRHANRLSEGDFNVSLKRKKSESKEIRALSNAYQNMVSKINDYMVHIENEAELKRKHIEDQNRILQMENIIKETQLDALRAQMDPHFLFNTINMITQTAYLEGSEKTVKLLNITADLLRYNIYNLHAEVLIHDELKSALNYIQIQKSRFGRRIKFNINIGKISRNYIIPSYVIQPLIENAVIHGISDKTSGAEISLNVQEAPDSIYIKVMDNGLGMDKTKIRQILKGEQLICSDKQKGKIGLFGIIERLKLLYNEDDLLCIESEINSGTAVIIRIPKKE